MQETLDELVVGSVNVVEFKKPSTMCNFTACLSNPCQNRGQCSVQGSGYSCRCQPGWSGKNCEKDNNECELGASCEMISIFTLVSSVCVCETQTSGGLRNFYQESKDFLATG